MHRTPRDEQALGVALNRHLGLVFDGRDERGAHAHFVAALELTAFGALHAGVLSSLLDVVCLLTLAPHLEAASHAVTHDLHLSVMRPVLLGSTCHLSGRVLRRGRTLAFLEAEAKVDEELVASARITKSIVAKPAGMP